MKTFIVPFFALLLSGCTGIKDDLTSENYIYDDMTNYQYEQIDTTLVYRIQKIDPETEIYIQYIINNTEL